MEGECIRWFVGGDLLIIRCKYYIGGYILCTTKENIGPRCVYFSFRETNETLISVWISNIPNFTVERLI